MSDRERIFLSPPHMGGTEMEHVREAFASNYVAPVGPQLAAFEQRFCELTGFPDAVAVASGTAAMHLALRAVGVGPGDVVLASSLTFIGSVSPIIYLGGEPVFIDCDPATWNLDPSLLEQAFEKLSAEGCHPRAVVPTDLYGSCCDVDAIRAICDRFGAALIIDAAESLGARQRGKAAGVGGDAAVFSFNGNKIITTGGGGMLASDDARIVERARHWSTQAREPVAHFEHNEIAYNYRMSNILAAIGLGQLEVLAERVKRKREIFAAYATCFAKVDGISMMPLPEYGESNGWLTVILIDAERFGTDRETVRLALETENIESRPMWKPMHLQPVFQTARSFGGDVAEDLFTSGLCLPSGTALRDEQIHEIAGLVATCGRACAGGE